MLRSNLSFTKSYQTHIAIQASSYYKYNRIIYATFNIFRLGSRQAAYGGAPEMERPQTLELPNLTRQPLRLLQFVFQNLSEREIEREKE